MAASGNRFGSCGESGKTHLVNAVRGQPRIETDSIPEKQNASPK